ncbi:MAG TPA: Na+/H+ antiporter subunit E [Spirochaetota bacterium]|nr:Na+/H+ antiporter subunit E [Spirochaetota bacterium]
MRFLFYAAVSLVTYCALTAGSGEVFYYWSIEELVVGVVLSVLIAGISYRIIPGSVSTEVLNPLKWLLGAFYMTGPFLFSLIIANIEVLYRIISGRIHPAIVRVETDLKSDLGTYFLANSITLAPGTLTIEMDPETHTLYIHCLNWKKKKGEKALPKDVASFLYFWIKLIYG